MADQIRERVQKVVQVYLQQLEDCKSQKEMEIPTRSSIRDIVEAVFDQHSV
jgi:hypothetical protein